VEKENEGKLANELIWKIVIRMEEEESPIRLMHLPAHAGTALCNMT